VHDGEGNLLSITVDLSKEFGPSASGKTIIEAYCDDCLARELGIHRHQARNATWGLAISGRFHRDSGACSKRPHHRRKKVTRA